MILLVCSVLTCEESHEDEEGSEEDGHGLTEWLQE
jgi:hypothetical protein